MNDIFEVDFFNDDIVEEDVDDDYCYYDYDEVYEDVDIFDENYFEATEGNKENKESKNAFLKKVGNGHVEFGRAIYSNSTPKSVRAKHSIAADDFAKREIELKYNAGGFIPKTKIYKAKRDENIRNIKSDINRVKLLSTSASSMQNKHAAQIAKDDMNSRIADENRKYGISQRLTRKLECNKGYDETNAKRQRQSKSVNGHIAKINAQSKVIHADRKVDLNPKKRTLQ